MVECRGPTTARRRLASIAIAALLALGIAVAPASVRPALAAGPLQLQADATYTLDPDAGRVHVAVRFRATNLKPSTATTFYFYRDLGFAIQAEATAIRASDGTGALSVTTRKRKQFVETEVHLRRDLLYRQSTTFTIRYDLVGGAPRSESPIRVGRAFATFGVWAWGDPGRATVEVRTPKGFGSQIDGGPLAIENAVTGQTLRAAPSDPDTFYAIVSAENRAAYGSSRISLEGGIEVVVQAWPEDDAWDETVTETLREGLPELIELIGLDWPVEHDLDVRERYTPALEGYAGIFFTDDQRIDVSEDLDPHVIIHEASHAWFHEALFTERWIYEGLAEEYAYQVLTAGGDDSNGLPAFPNRDDPGVVTLNAWTFPQVIRDQETDDRERYGYAAAFWVVHRIASKVGPDRMRDAFAAADADLTAYPGAPAREKVASRDGWRRFLDLVESFERDDATDTERAFRDHVLRVNEVRELDERAEARDLYVELLEAGEGWLPPWYVRQPMGEWRFEMATDRLEEATAILRLRDRVATAADGLGLQPDDALRQAYEGATEGFHGVTGIGDDQLAALAAIEDARMKVAAEPDLVSQLGLLGEPPPEGPYEASRAGFERGDLDLAVTSAAAAGAIVTGAAAVGQGRIILAAAVALALLVLILVVVALRRRGRRRRALASAGVASSATASVAGWPEPAPTEPYATLAADPAALSPPPAASPPDLEGDERA